MHTTGSNSFSPGTSIHVISIALGSPGEQGVKRSSTIVLGSALEGPRTLFKQKKKDGIMKWGLINHKVLPWNIELRLFQKTYPFEVSCWLHLSNRLHESISDNDTDICARVSIGFLAKSSKIRLSETVGGWAQMELEHKGAGMLLGQRDVDPLLKSEKVFMMDSERRRTNPLSEFTKK